eukprot:Mycagemm_TRINITY_DN10360_c1_g2::TRINITY_DN10360_c1_g2_i2::g.1265::m.1265 type:complete len:128 gc:universal TRINITY_DN10360_c1_g2_i2:814-1197(+)
MLRSLSLRAPLTSGRSSRRSSTGRMRGTWSVSSYRVFAGSTLQWIVERNPCFRWTHSLPSCDSVLIRHGATSVVGVPFSCVGSSRWRAQRTWRAGSWTPCSSRQSPSRFAPRSRSAACSRGALCCSA